MSAILQTIRVLRRADVASGRRRLLSTLATVLVLWAACVFTGAAVAQPYPSRPITLVTAFPPGGSTDSVARALGVELAADLQQPVVIDTRPGASQVVAGALVARAAPNGYTLFIMSLPNLIPPSLVKTLPYGGNTGFTAVAPVVNVGPVLVTSTKLPAGNLREFIALLKANPDKYTFGGAGVGASQHIWGEMFNAASGTRSKFIPFKGVNDVVTQLVNGELDWAFVNFSALQFASSGKLKVIGVPSATRDADHPAVPTLDEQGLKGFNVATAVVLVAPKETPPEILQQINTAVAAATGRDSFIGKLRALGGVQRANPLGPKQTDEWIAREDEKLNSLIRDKRLSVD